MLLGTGGDPAPIALVKAPLKGVHESGSMGSFRFQQTTIYPSQGLTCNHFFVGRSLRSRRFLVVRHAGTLPEGSETRGAIG
jgi:hypothetical protein